MRQTATHYGLTTKQQLHSRSKKTSPVKMASVTFSQYSSIEDYTSEVNKASPLQEVPQNFSC